MFKEIMSLLQDKEKMDIAIIRVGDELTVLVSPKINSKTADVIITGTPEELDADFFNELKKPIEKMQGLKSNADEVEIKDDDSDEDNTAKSKTSKSPAPAPAKKEEPKKRGRKKKEDPVINKTNDQIDDDQDDDQEEEENNSSVQPEAEPVPEKSPEQLFKEALQSAEAAFAAKKYKTAQDHYEEAVKYQPDNDKAIAGLRQAKLWVKQLTSMNIKVE